MEPCLFGAETEYALAAVAHDGRGAPHTVVHGAFMACARRILPHLPHQMRGDYPSVFLVNGGRLYDDCGYRVEYSSPEVTSPWELVRYMRAGDIVGERVARQLAVDHPEWQEVFCSRASVDYHQQTAWGAHESYLIRGHHPTDLRDALVPFLVSRIVYTGAGGFDAYHRGLRFLLMPRAAFTTQTAAENTMHDRPIFSTRDEPLARAPHGRLHVACGESLSSDLALFLRTGATALVVRALERDPTLAASFTLDRPVAALRSIAADPSCRRRVALADGRRVTAVEIQRGYLALVEVGIARGWMPTWANDVCARWRAVLDRLADDPASLDTTLEWAIKWRLYRHYLEQHGIGRRTLIEVNQVLGPRRRALPHGWSADLAGEIEALSSLVDALEAAEDDAGHPESLPDDAQRALECRERLFEIDMRWGQLGPRGVFRALDERGVLSHRVEGCDRFEDAADHPPDVGRARLRGEAVQRLWNAGRRITCAWAGIQDHEAGRHLDLSDPFEEEERWV